MSLQGKYLLSNKKIIKCDLLIEAKWVIPAVPEGLVLEHHAVVIQDKKIIAIMPAQQAHQAYRATQTVTLPEHALIPGLINAHGHSPMTLLRGIADDIPLKQWLEQHIWPLEGRFVDEKFVYDGSRHAIAEMISSGTTSFADGYFFPDQVAKAVLEAGMRVQLASPVLDFPTQWAQDANEYIAKATQLHDDFRNNEFIYTAFGPHAPYTVSDAPLRKLATLAEEMDVPIHIHVHETAAEVAEALALDGRRPLKRLADLGMVSPRLLCVHATQLLDAEIQMLGALGGSVLHCPESNLKLASGFCEVAKLLAHNVNVALGTDGGASNNDLDMLSEMRTAALLAKGVAANASALPAARALTMATLNGARALGLESKIGSLEIGKYADITAVSLQEFNSSPVYNPISALVYSATAAQVSHVWCAGKALLANRELLTLEKARILHTTQAWRQKIATA